MSEPENENRSFLVCFSLQTTRDADGKNTTQNVSSYLNSYSRKWFSNLEDWNKLKNENTYKIYVYK